MPEPGEARVCLRVEGLSRRFGGFHALRDVHMEVRAGDVHAVIGPNGAGKTTLFNLLSGVLAADSGRVRFDDVSLDGLRPHRRTALGIARTFQNIRLFGNMTVQENVMLAMHGRSFPSLWSAFRVGVLHKPFRRVGQERRMQDASMELLEFVGLADRAEHNASDLSYGQRRLLEIARALGTGPRLLMLDEPAAGMNPHETEELDTLIERVRARGVTILLVEHDMNLVMGISDRITVLNFGVKIAEGLPTEIQQDRAVIEAYLGEEELL